MVRTAVYLATPVRGRFQSDRRRNYLRAVLLARLAVNDGLAPLVPALTVGAVLESFPTAEPQQDHPAAMSCCMGLLRAVKVAGGRLWVLTRDDGELSEGCAGELRTWRAWLSAEGGTRDQSPLLLRWRDLEDRMVSAGLYNAWELLRDQNCADLDLAARLIAEPFRARTE